MNPAGRFRTAHLARRGSERAMPHSVQTGSTALARNYLISLQNHHLQIYSPRASQAHRSLKITRRGAGTGVGMVEGLERRRLLAAAVSVALGKLTIAGTSANDVVDVAKVTGGLRVTVD